MQGDPQIIQGLNLCLKDQLTAINQLFLHARMARDWGFGRFNDYEYERSIKATPNRGTPDPLNVGSNVKEMLENDLQVEYAVGAALKEAIKVCEEEQDYDTRRILLKLLDDTEMDHTYFLERQLGLIQKVGLQNYIQSQMGEEPASA